MWATARSAVTRAVIQASARSTSYQGGGRATGGHLNAVHLVLGPLCRLIKEPRYSWMLLCCGDETRLGRVNHALHDIAMQKFPRTNADRLMALCFVVALDMSRHEDRRIPVLPETKRLLEEQGEPCPDADPWSGAWVARKIGLRKQVYYRDWEHKREVLEDELNGWGECWITARDILIAQGVIREEA